MVSDHFKDAERDYLAEDGKTVNPWPLRPGHVHPESLRETLAEFRVHPQELDGETLQRFVPQAAEIDQAKDRRLYSVAKIVAEAASVQAAATYAMQQGPWDFTAVYFDAIDHFCHGFMRYHPPRLPWVSEKDFALYQDVVNSGYRFHDMLLGVLLELVWGNGAGPGTNVILCSDHGFHPDHLRVQEIPNEPAGPADEHRHFGVFAACGPAFKRDELVFGATLLDITPTILRLHDLPVGEDMDGKPLLQALRDAKPLALIPSWDDVPGDDGRHPDDVRIDPVDARESLQQLVDLGYIEDLGEDKKKVAETTIKELRYNLARDLADAGKLAEALLIHAELWAAHPDESRFGLHLFNGQLRQADTAAARETLALLESRKADYAERASAELDQLKEDWKDKNAEDYTEQEQRRLRRLRKQAGTNQATFAWLQGRLLAAEGRHGEALVAFEQAEQVQMHNRPSLYLQAGGLPILTDGARAADADNPRGYLEYEAAKRPDAGTGWLADARGKAVKIVAQLLPALTATHRYRVIFAERPLNEILASRRVMLERTGKPGGRIAERQLAQTYVKQIAQVKRILLPHGERVQVLSVPYDAALSDPAALAARLNAFLGGGLDEPAMAAAVAPGLRRQHGGDADR